MDENLKCSQVLIKNFFIYIAFFHLISFSMMVVFIIIVTFSFFFFMLQNFQIYYTNKADGCSKVFNSSLKWKVKNIAIVRDIKELLIPIYKSNVSFLKLPQFIVKNLVKQKYLYFQFNFLSSKVISNQWCEKLFWNCILTQPKKFDKNYACISPPLSTNLIISINKGHISHQLSFPKLHSDLI